MSSKILVIGATGTVGRELVVQLTNRGEKVRGVTRNPEAAARLFGKPIELVKFDLEQPESYPAALSGVDQVFLMARPGDEQADRLALPLIDQMKRYGVQHVVDLSALGVERIEAAALRKIERYLEGSGMTYTHLRPNWFMQIFSGGPLHAALCATGAIELPAADAKISYIDARDIAAVAAKALCEAGHANQAYTLTGAVALDHHEIARALAAAAGKPLRYVPVEEDLARQAILKAGLPVARVERLLGFYRLVRAGACALVSPDVQRILSRPPISFAQFVRENAARWQ